MTKTRARRLVRLAFSTDHVSRPDLPTVLDQTHAEAPVERAKAALKMRLAMFRSADSDFVPSAEARLLEMLDDPDADVRRAAASSLGVSGQPVALDRLLELLEDEPGDRASPMAAAVTFIALNLPTDGKERVLGALWRFGLRGIPAARQIQDLTWRLGGGTDRGYPARLTMHVGSDAGQQE